MVYFLRMKLKLNTQQVQKQFLIPYMQQSISILVLPILEVSAAIEQEIQSNPLLEIDEEQLAKQTPPPVSPIRQETSDTGKDVDEFGDFADLTSNKINRDPISERPMFREVSLEDMLLQQLRVEISDPQKLKIGEIIISNLSHDGYLSVSLEEIAKSFEFENVAVLEEVLRIIQTFEPLGIAARDLKECLLLQIKAKFPDHLKIGTLVIQNHLEQLAEKKFSFIAKKLSIPIAEIDKIFQIISSLNPKPACNHRPLLPNIYIRPDVTILKDSQNNFQIIISKEGIPPLRVSSSYRYMLNQPNLTNEEKIYIREKLRNAQQFIKGIQQRGQTLYEVAEFILNKQKPFFNGEHLSIAPMTLKDIATAIERNESTVSRAINDKYMETPVGLFSLKFFFSQAVNGENSAGVSSRGIKEEIKDLIETEDKSSPLSDQEIQSHFERKGLSLARRTVSKYRKVLQILPSHLRKNKIKYRPNNHFQPN